MNTIIKDSNGNLIDISKFSFNLHKKVYDGSTYVEMSSLKPSQIWRWIRRLSKFVPPFTPFDNSLKKIYGDDFFGDKHDQTHYFDGYVMLRRPKVYRSDTDGNIAYIGEYPLMTFDPVKTREMWLKTWFGDKYKNVGIASNLATKRLNLNLAQLKEAVRRYNKTIDLWKNDDGTTTAIY